MAVVAYTQYLHVVSSLSTHSLQVLWQYAVLTVHWCHHKMICSVNYSNICLCNYTWASGCMPVAVACSGACSVWPNSESLACGILTPWRQPDHCLSSLLVSSWWCLWCCCCCCDECSLLLGDDGGDTIICSNSVIAVMIIHSVVQSVGYSIMQHNSIEFVWSVQDAVSS